MLTNQKMQGDPTISVLPYNALLALIGTKKASAAMVSSRPWHEVWLLVQFGSGFRVPRIECCGRTEDVIGFSRKRFIPEFLRM